MAISNSAVRITELDPLSIRENLKVGLKSGYFSDYDFEGSGLSALLDVLAYNTHYGAVYLNAVGNEMWLDTAQLRDSIISRAKLVNYIPTSKIAPTAIVNIKVTPGQLENQNTQTITLHKYNRFVADNDLGQVFGFVCMNTQTEVKTANGTFEFSNVFLQQGETITNQFLYSTNNTKRRFNIPTANVDIQTLVVRVQESITNSYSELYIRASDITQINANSKVFFVEEATEANGVYSIILGDGYLGKKPKDGNIIIATYLDTLGPDANKAVRFTALDDIDNFIANVSITTVSPSAGGSNKESIDNIKFRAPLYYTTQNRAVTKKDYESILLKDYPNIDAISVWGGEENSPPVYGKTFISMKPKDGYYITAPEKDRIVNEIIKSRSILTVTPEIVDPEFLFILINLKVTYNPLLTNFDADDLKSLIRQTVLDYRDNELTKFGATFRTSQFLRAIDNVDPSIKSSSVNFYLQKRLEPVLGESKNYTLSYNEPLKNSGIFDKMYTYPEFGVTDFMDEERNVKIEEITDTITGITSIKVVSGGVGYKSIPRVSIIGDGVGATAVAKVVNQKVSSIEITNPGTAYTKATVVISGGSGTGATATALLQANQADLQTYYYKPTGEKIIVNKAAGKLSYDTGELTLLNFLPISIVPNANYLDSVITFNVRPLSDTISAAKNQILAIDEGDSRAIQITMIRE
jgi:hypothetical protein